MTNVPITISFGDGIGPQIMHAALQVLRQSMAHVHVHTLEIGQRAYHHGFRYGIPASCMDKIMECGVLLRAPSGPPLDPNFHCLDIPEYLGCTQRYTTSYTTESLSIADMRFINATAHISPTYSVFEPAHSEAPELSEADSVNPSGMILATVMMLYHIQHTTTAHLIHNAWLKTIEDHYRTADMADETTSKQDICNTEEFTEAILNRLGQTPKILRPIELAAHLQINDASIV